MLTYDQALRDLKDYSNQIQRLTADRDRLKAALEEVVGCWESADGMNMQATQDLFDEACSKARRALAKGTEE